MSRSWAFTFIGCFMLLTSVGFSGDDAPTAMCQDITIQLDSSGSYFLMPEEVDGGSTYDGTSISVDIDTFSCSDVGSIYPVTLTVENFDGQMDSCTANVTVEDVTPPDMMCMNKTVYLDIIGNASIMPEDIDAGSFDNCFDPLTLSVNVDSFNCSDIGSPVSVILTGEDLSGNTASCTSMIMVVDNIAPDIQTCGDSPTEAVFAPMGGSAPMSNFTENVTVLENCSSLVVISQIPAPGARVGIGTNQVWIWATDENGNSNSCPLEFVVEVAPPAVIINSDPEAFAFTVRPGLTYRVEFLDDINVEPQAWIEITNFVFESGGDTSIPIDINDGGFNRIYRYLEIFP